MIEKPMLAGTCKDVEAIAYPVLCSPKLDGIRCIVQGGRVLSRKFKDIPNHHIRKTLLDAFLGWEDFSFDGELMVGQTFQACTSGIMSRSGNPNFVFHVFDCVDGKQPLVGFKARLETAAKAVFDIGDRHVRVVPHQLANTEEELLDLEQRYLAEGHEGLMVRSINGPYKHGRSTAKQGWLLKVKRFVDAEAEVIGFVELLHNANELKTDELGYAKRSSAKDGKVPMGTLGKFLVRDLRDGTEFRIGTGRGLTQALRQEIWDHQDQYLGKIVKFRYQEHGVKDKPRIPVWLGFRDPSDM